MSWQEQLLKVREGANPSGIKKLASNHKIAAVFLAVILGASAIGGVLYFSTAPGTVHIRTGAESYTQTVTFTGTNAANSTTQPVKVFGHIVNASTNPSSIGKVFENTGNSWLVNVTNLTQGDYVILTVTINNTGAGDLPFANYSTLNATENSPTGSPFYAWKENGKNVMAWDNGQNIGAVEGNFYPTHNLTSVLFTNQTKNFTSRGMNASVATNQTLDIIMSGPPTGFGSSTANPYPAQIMPGQSVSYEVIVALGAYASNAYLNQTYDISFGIGAQ